MMLLDISNSIAKFFLNLDTTTFDSIYNTIVNDDLAGFCTLSNIICGLCALVMIGNILLNTWAKGEPIDIRGLFRPFF